MVLWPDDRLNQVIVVAAKSLAEELANLIGALDKPATSKTKVYVLKAINHADGSIDQGLLGSSAGKRVSIDCGCRIAITGRLGIARDSCIDQIIAQLDVAIAPE